MKNNFLWAVLFLLPCLLAWWGMDFSPSFTMMFLTVQVICCAVSYLLLIFTSRPVEREDGQPPCRGAKWISILAGILFAVGVAFSIPSVYIYAAGEDYLNLFFTLSPPAGLILAILIWMLKKGKSGQHLGLAENAGNWLLAWAAFFALLCGWRSPGILPYGVGLLLYLLAINLVKRKYQSLLVWLSFLIITLASVLPGVCQ